LNTQLSQKIRHEFFNVPSQPKLNYFHSMPPETTLPTKRGPGRPKGSKNKPDAGTKGNPVGRPRKYPSTNDVTAASTSMNKNGKRPTRASCRIQLTGCICAIAGNAPERESQQGIDRRPQLLATPNVQSDRRDGEFETINVKSTVSPLALFISLPQTKIPKRTVN